MGNGEEHTSASSSSEVLSVFVAHLPAPFARYAHALHATPYLPYRALREFDGKAILASRGLAPVRVAQISAKHDWLWTEEHNAWLRDTKLVAKPDCLIKRRGKGGLVLLNKDWDETKAWLSERLDTDVDIEGVEGRLSHFIVEPFLPHAQEDEYYVAITSDKNGEEILFYHAGGVDVGDVDSKAARLRVGTLEESPDAAAVQAALLTGVPDERQEAVADYISRLFMLYRELHFVYLEINPLVWNGHGVTPLDLAAKVDEAAAYLVGKEWGDIDFPAPFGRQPAPEEAYIRDLDSKTGASLKLTILNRRGRVWTMVAGGGASVVYADTVSDLGWGKELANYGEYSGAPTEGLTYEYAKTILQCMTKVYREEGKVLIIGGGIANFTDVAKTFKGIIRALREYATQLQEHKVTVWVRRGGPNYSEGLRIMRQLGRQINLPIHVYGPKTHITAIVPMALGMDVKSMGLAVVESGADGSPMDSPVPEETEGAGDARASTSSAADPAPAGAAAAASGALTPAHAAVSADEAAKGNTLFHPGTSCIVFGMQLRAVQGMLDFDFMCQRETPSVAAMVFPFSSSHYQKFYWGSKEIMIPVYPSTAEAVSKFPDVSVFINFASFRSVYQSTMDALEHPQLHTMAIIAEGVPEQLTRRVNAEAASKGVTIIGPATVGGVVPGCFRIGNSGGMIDNIMASKLYRSGSVAYVSKSGGMSNELNNIMSLYTDGVAEGVAIGGDRYPGSRFIDHILRYEANPNVKMIVLLGEVGGIDEYEVCEALKTGRITKPLVAWCIGTCAKMFPYEVQFGHAGALANSEAQTADAKNTALAAAGAVVPANFNDFAAKIKSTYQALVADGTIVPKPEVEPPRVPMDYSWAKSLGLIRKPSSFVSTISDERGEELLYAGMPISQVFEEGLGLGGVVSLLWFQRRLPDYCTKFIELILMVTADHGPAVSGAHNTIVAARAGKDLVSSLCSGLLTVGPRFGGALDAAAIMFSQAYDANKTPEAFVKETRAQNKLIMGIGHRVKSLQNPDKRVTIVKEFARKYFEASEVLDFACEVEKITTAKKPNLILNVDGAIACAFVDMLRSCGAFTREEAIELIDNGCLNGLFVLGRSIGFIGHFLDQKRLKQGLYRHPWDDISYQDSTSMGQLTHQS